MNCKLKLNNGKRGANVKIGDRVKVKEQDIYGCIVDAWKNYVVIEDEDSEYPWPENRLEYRVSDVELINEVRT